MSRKIEQGIEIRDTREHIFESLLNPSSIMKWWQAKTAIIIKENNGIYAVSWGNDLDDPDFITVSHFKNFDPPKEFSLEYSSYYAKSGNLPFEAPMITNFKINQLSDTVCDLQVVQSGIPDDAMADEYYDGCKKGWKQVLANIKDYCENI